MERAWNAKNTEHPIYLNLLLLIWTHGKFKSSPGHQFQRRPVSRLAFFMHTTCGMSREAWTPAATMPAVRTPGQLIKRWREPPLEAMLRKRGKPPSPGHQFQRRPVLGLAFFCAFFMPAARPRIHAARAAMPAGTAGKPPHRQPPPPAGRC